MLSAACCSSEVREPAWLARAASERSWGRDEVIPLLARTAGTAAAPRMCYSAPACRPGIYLPLHTLYEPVGSLLWTWSSDGDAG